MRHAFTAASRRAPDLLSASLYGMIFGLRMRAPMVITPCLEVIGA